MTSSVKKNHFFLWLVYESIDVPEILKLPVFLRHVKNSGKYFSIAFCELHVSSFHNYFSNLKYFGECINRESLSSAPGKGRYKVPWKTRSKNICTYTYYSTSVKHSIYAAFGVIAHD